MSGSTSATIASCASSTPMLNPASSGTSPAALGVDLAEGIRESEAVNEAETERQRQPRARQARQQIDAGRDRDRCGDRHLDRLRRQVHGAGDRERQRGRMRDRERGDDGDDVARRPREARRALPRPSTGRSTDGSSSNNTNAMWS